MENARQYQISPEEQAERLAVYRREQDKVRAEIDEIIPLLNVEGELMDVIPLLCPDPKQAADMHKTVLEIRDMQLDRLFRTLNCLAEDYQIQGTVAELNADDVAYIEKLCEVILNRDVVALKAMAFFRQLDDAQLDSFLNEMATMPAEALREMTERMFIVMNRAAKDVCNNRH